MRTTAAMFTNMSQMTGLTSLNLGMNSIPLGSLSQMSGVGGVNSSVLSNIGAVPQMGGVNVMNQASNININPINLPNPSGQNIILPPLTNHL